MDEILKKKKKERKIGKEKIKLLMKFIVGKKKKK